MTLSCFVFQIISDNTKLKKKRKKREREREKKKIFAIIQNNSVNVVDVVNDVVICVMKRQRRPSVQSFIRQFPSYACGPVPGIHV